MRALDILRDEHRWIAQMIACLEAVVRDAEQRGRVEAGPASECLALFACFADGLHQQHEEDYLFPRMLARAGSVADKAWIGRLVAEHEEERHHLQGMHATLLGAIYGEPSKLREFLREAHVYLAVQTAHLAHENGVLFPLAERVLSREDDAQMLRGFQNLDGGDPDGRRRLAERIHQLGERLGLTARAASQH